MVTKSSPKTYSQSQLTKIFAVTANVPAADQLTLKYRIWFNPTEDSSLRLTLEGYRFVTKDVKLQSYGFELEEPLTNRNLLQLERYFQSVYYLFKNTKIVVFEESEATMLALHSGDLKTYLENLELEK